VTVLLSENGMLPVVRQQVFDDATIV
jgi:hypothetical protein